MLQKEILTYEAFRNDLQSLINKYIELGIPAVIQIPVFNEALGALTKYSEQEIVDANTFMEKAKQSSESFDESKADVFDGDYHE